MNQEALECNAHIMKTLLVYSYGVKFAIEAPLP